MKSSFISAAAHELKTPLSSLVSCSEILLDYAVEDPETQREFLGIINAESKRLARMIDDVLELSRLDSGSEEWQIEELSLAEVIEDALEVTEELIKERGIEVRLNVEEGLPPVQADREALVKTIANLISNATNSSEPDGEIEVRGWREGEAVRLDMVDHGPGIAAEDQEKVFDRFAQVMSHTTDRATSTGLELAISKEIIERLGGHIWVENEPGRGNTFSFTLPAGGGRPNGL